LMSSTQQVPQSRARSLPFFALIGSWLSIVFASIFSVHFKYIHYSLSLPTRRGSSISVISSLFIEYISLAYIAFRVN
jgi:hypothetical protein